VAVEVKPGGGVDGGGGVSAGDAGGFCDPFPGVDGTVSPLGYAAMQGQSRGM
jgi:hypothetical protein